jgi:sialate O-acetylesterase
MIPPSIRRLLGCCSVLLVAVGVVAAQESRPSPTRVWVLAGQSNMEGNGWLDGSAAEPDVRILRVEGDAARWEVGVEPSHRAVVPKDLPGWAAGPPKVGRFDGRKGASPGVAFAAHRARTTRSVVGLIPVAVGGTSLDAWSAARKSDPESLYAKMLARVKASGMKPEGVLWYQGEADAVGKPEAAETYAARLDAWIADVRRDLGDPELPVIAAQLCRYVVERDATGWNTVQEVQRLLPSRMARTECVATVDLSLDDPIHLSADAERRLGVRFAKAAASLFGEEDAPTSGPRPLKIEIEGPRRDRIVVTYRGVNGTLSPATRVQGFSLADATGKPLPIIFDAAVDAARPDTVLLRLAASVPEGAALWYGRGLDPVCNLVDDEDLAAPVFGPYRLGQR